MLTGREGRDGSSYGGDVENGGREKSWKVAAAAAYAGACWLLLSRSRRSLCVSILIVILVHSVFVVVGVRGDAYTTWSLSLSYPVFCVRSTDYKLIDSILPWNGFMPVRERLVPMRERLWCVPSYFSKSEARPCFSGSHSLKNYSTPFTKH